MKKDDAARWGAIIANDPSLAKVSGKTLRVCDLPGFRDLEARLRYLAFGNRRPLDDYAEGARLLAEKTFGVAHEETEFYYPDNYETMAQAELIEFDTKADAFEDQFLTGDELTDDETVAELLRIGVDFTDDRGQPMLCTKMISRQVELSAKRGLLPDPKSVNAESWGDKLARQAENWKRDRRR